MKKRLEEIIEAAGKYNAGDMAKEMFGLSGDVHYDALVIAPGWKPTKILDRTDYGVRVMAEHSYVSGYEVEIGDKLLGWVQCASGSCNLVDHLILCASLDFDKLIFVGAVGGLRPEFPLGTVCTPMASISGGMAEAYLLDDLREWTPFGEVKPNDPEFVDAVCALADFPVKRGRVFCTDSIFCEYDHLDFIRGFDVDLIEMETSAFYRMAGLMEKPSVALLVVSDNSASGQPLMGRDDALQEAYNRGRKVLVPRLLEKMVNM